MSFLNGLRGMMSGNPELSDEWTIPETVEEIDGFFEPDSGMHIIYKHSYSCGTSIFAKTRVEQTFKNDLPENVHFYFVDVRTHRPVSNAIAEKSGIMHESPQLIIINEGKVLWHGSHNQVTSEPISKFLKELKTGG